MRYPISLALAGLTVPGPVLAAAATTAEQASRPRTPPVSEQTVVVTATRERGSIPVDVEPVITVDASEIASYGVSNLGELLQALEPQTGSARGRGGGPPVILLNGRRISGFAELRFVPPEAIQRVEIFPEDVAVVFGFAPDQRVVNFVLRAGFRAVSAELGTGREANGNRTLGDVEGTLFRVDANGRSLVNVELDRSSRVTEAGLGVTSGGNPLLRSLLPRQSELTAGVNLNRGFGERHALTVDLRQDLTTTQSLLGQDPRAAPGTAILRDGEVRTTRLAFTLDGADLGWQWTATAVAESLATDRQDSGGTGPGQSASVTDTLEGTFSGVGPMVDLPAGAVRGGFRISGRMLDLDSSSVQAGRFTGTRLSRDETALRGNITIPLASRSREVLGGLGDLSLSLNAGIQELSDAGTLANHGATLSWGPVDGVRVSLSTDHREAAPSVQQLGDPLVIDPDAEFFDFATGRSERVALSRAGNPGLRPEQRDDLTLNASWSPPQLRGALTVQASWVRNESTDPISALPTGPVAQAVFASRFTRDGSGRLIAVDNRPVNLAATRGERIRWGLSLSAPIGPQPAARGGPPGAGGPPAAGGPPTAGGPPASGSPPGAGGPSPGRPLGGPPGSRAGGASAGGPSGPPPAPAPGAQPPTAAGPPRGGPPGGFGGMMGRGGPPAGGMASVMMGGPGGGPNRISVSLFHTYRIEETVQLVAGGPTLDLLAGDTLGSSGGLAEHGLELEGGVSWNGIGVRVSGNWDSGSTVRLPAGGTLDFEPFTTLNARVFMNLDQRESLIRAVPFLRGSRLFLRVDNVTGETRDVRDQAGLVPLAFQPAFANPRGRSWELGWRKQFGPGAARATGPASGAPPRVASPG